MRFKKAELDVRTRYIADLEKSLTTYFKLLLSYLRA